MFSGATDGFSGDSVGGDLNIAGGDMSPLGAEADDFGIPEQFQDALDMFPESSVQDGASDKSLTVDAGDASDFDWMTPEQRADSFAFNSLQSDTRTPAQIEFDTFNSAGAEVEAPVDSNGGEQADAPVPAADVQETLDRINEVLGDDAGSVPVDTSDIDFEALMADVPTEAEMQAQQAEFERDMAEADKELAEVQQVIRESQQANESAQAVLDETDVVLDKADQVIAEAKSVHQAASAAKPMTWSERFASVGKSIYNGGVAAVSAVGSAGSAVADAAIDAGSAAVDAVGDAVDEAKMVGSYVLSNPDEAGAAFVDGAKVGVDNIERATVQTIAGATEKVGQAGQVVVDTIRDNVDGDAVANTIDAVAPVVLGRYGENFAKGLTGDGTNDESLGQNATGLLRNALGTADGISENLEKEGRMIAELDNETFDQAWDEGIAEGSQDVAEFINDGIELAEDAGEQVVDFVEALPENIEKIGEQVEEFVQSIPENVEKAAEQVAEFAVGIGEDIQAGVEYAIENPEAFIADVKVGIGETVETIADTAEAVGESLEKGAELVGQGLEQLGEDINTVLENPAEFAAALDAELMRSTYNAGQVTQDFVELAVENPVEAAHVALDAIGALDPTPITDLAHAAWLGVEGVFGKEGAYAMAGLTAIAAVPYVGDVIGKGFKYGMKGVDAASSFIKGADVAGDVVTTAGRVAGDVVDDGASVIAKGAGDAPVPSTVVADATPPAAAAPAPSEPFLGSTLDDALDATPPANPTAQLRDPNINKPAPAEGINMPGESTGMGNNNLVGSSVDAPVPPKTSAAGVGDNGPVSPRASVDDGVPAGAGSGVDDVNVNPRADGTDLPSKTDTPDAPDVNAPKPDQPPLNSPEAVAEAQANANAARVAASESAARRSALRESGLPSGVAPDEVNKVTTYRNGEAIIEEQRIYNTPGSNQRTVVTSKTAPDGSTYVEVGRAGPNASVTEGGQIIPDDVNRFPYGETPTSTPDVPGTLVDDAGRNPVNASGVGEQFSSVTVNAKTLDGMSPELAADVQRAIDKGIVTRANGVSGVKKLSGNGIDGYLWEVKMVGRNGATRVLGNMDESGRLVFEKVIKK